MSSILSWLGSKAAAFAAALAALAALIGGVFLAGRSAGSNAQKVKESEHDLSNAEALARKKDQQAAVVRPGTDDALDRRLRDPKQDV